MTTAAAPGDGRFQRDVPPAAPVTSGSICLFRLGELCNYRCPMCSNSGRKAAFHIPEAALLERVDRLRRWGFRRVVLTGGEPTIHPAFWRVVTELNDVGIAWDLNTHGGSFADPALAERAVDEGLRRAIVSLHDERGDVGAAIFGVRPADHASTLRGVDHLLAAGAELTINCVLSALNRDHVVAFVDACAARWGTEPQLKIAFPSTTGKGGGWAAIHLRYADVRDEVRAAMARAEALGVRLDLESFPACVSGDPGRRNLSRSGFGETHYLEDIDGAELFSIAHIEATLSCYGPACRGCAALNSCPGIAQDYASRHGFEELVPYD